MRTNGDETGPSPLQQLQAIDLQSLEGVTEHPANVLVVTDEDTKVQQDTSHKVFTVSGKKKKRGQKKKKKVQNSHPCPGHWLMGQMLSGPWNSQAQGPFLASIWTSLQAQGPVLTGGCPARAGFSKAATLRLLKEHLLRQTGRRQDLSPMRLLL